MKHKHQQTKGSISIASFLRISLLSFVCFIAFGAFVAALVHDSTSVFGNGYGPQASPSGLTKKDLLAKAQCNVTGKPDCPTRPLEWIPLKSESTQDVISAVKETTMFKTSSNSADLIGLALKKGNLGIPYKVKPYRDDVDLPEVWVVPVVNQQNIPLALLAFVYDTIHKQIHAIEFGAVTNNMFYTKHPFPSVNLNSAKDAVIAAKGIGLNGTDSGELIYFPTNENDVLKGKVHWISGGTTFFDPIWKVKDTKGNFHYVDHDGNIRDKKILPLITGALPLL